MEKPAKNSEKPDESVAFSSVGGLKFLSVAFERQNDAHRAGYRRSTV
jgi:hypothetical protein